LDRLPSRDYTGGITVLFEEDSEVAGIPGGITTPPLMTIFIPSSTVIGQGIQSSSGTSRRNPEVGLGVVGMNTE